MRRAASGQHLTEHSDESGFYRQRDRGQQTAESGASVMLTARPGYWLEREGGGGAVEERARLGPVQEAATWPRAAGSPWAGVKVEPTGRAGILGCSPEFPAGPLSGQMVVVVPSTKIKTGKEGKHRGGLESQLGHIGWKCLSPTQAETSSKQLGIQVGGSGSSPSWGSNARVTGTGTRAREKPPRETL